MLILNSQDYMSGTSFFKHPNLSRINVAIDALVLVVDVHAISSSGSRLNLQHKNALQLP
jgi:hypothetical protein